MCGVLLTSCVEVQRCDPVAALFSHYGLIQRVHQHSHANMAHQHASEIYLLVDGAGLYSHSCNQDARHYREACHRPKQDAPNLRKTVRGETSISDTPLSPASLCALTATVLVPDCACHVFLSHIISERNKSVRTSIPCATLFPKEIAQNVPMTPPACKGHCAHSVYITCTTCLLTQNNHGGVRQRER